MPLAIRSASPNDKPAVLSLWQTCGLVVSYNDPASDFRFAKQSPCADVLVGADETGGIRGCVMVGHDGHRGWLYYLATDPGLRRRGLGREMVRAAENWLRERGVGKVQLMVRETNSAVAGFYDRLGYETTPRIVMSRWLTTREDGTRPSPNG